MCSPEKIAKIISFLCLLLQIDFAGASLPGPYGFDVSLHNVCDYPVQIVVFNHRLKVLLLDEELNIEKPLNPNESTLVFQGIYNSSEIKHVLPKDYRLEISANGKTLSLDKARFLEILKKSDYSQGKCGIFCRTYDFSGTIKDPSLCP